jgi:hypothetical protein
MVGRESLAQLFVRSRSGRAPGRRRHRNAGSASAVLDVSLLSARLAPSIARTVFSKNACCCADVIFRKRLMVVLSVTGAPVGFVKSLHIGQSSVPKRVRTLHTRGSDERNRSARRIVPTARQPTDRASLTSVFLNGALLSGCCVVRYHRAGRRSVKKILHEIALVFAPRVAGRNQP